MEEEIEQEFGELVTFANRHLRRPLEDEGTDGQSSKHSFPTFPEPCETVSAIPACAHGYFKKLWAERHRYDHTLMYCPIPHTIFITAPYICFVVPLTYSHSTFVFNACPHRWVRRYANVMTFTAGAGTTQRLEGTNGNFADMLARNSTFMEVFMQINEYAEVLRVRHANRSSSRPTSQSIRTQKPLEGALLTLSISNNAFKACGDAMIAADRYVATPVAQPDQPQEPPSYALMPSEAVHHCQYSVQVSHARLATKLPDDSSHLSSLILLCIVTIGAVWCVRL